MNNNDDSSLQIHSFNKNIAKKCGILSAVIYNHIEFWIQKNEAEEKHFYDGKYWTYSTLTGMQKIFDYATVKQIRLAIDKLIKADLIETGNYNKTPYDRTLWYSLKGKSNCPKGQMEILKRANGNSQKGTPIPDILTDILTDQLKELKDCEIENQISLSDISEESKIPEKQEIQEEINIVSSQPIDDKQKKEKKQKPKLKPDDPNFWKFLKENAQYGQKFYEATKLFPVGKQFGLWIEACQEFREAGVTPEIIPKAVSLARTRKWPIKSPKSILTAAREIKMNQETVSSELDGWLLR